MTSPKWPTNGPSENETWEEYFAKFHAEHLRLKDAEDQVAEDREDYDNIVVLEKSVEVVDLATLDTSKRSALPPGTLALAAVNKGWEVRAAKSKSLAKGRTTKDGSKTYADKENANVWIEGRIPGKPFAFRAHWVRTSFQAASCWGVEDAAFIWPKGTIERAVKYLEDAEQFAYFVNFKGLFMNVEQVKDMMDKRETAKVMKRIAKQEKARAEKGGVDVVAS